MIHFNDFSDILQSLRKRTICVRLFQGENPERIICVHLFQGEQSWTHYLRTFFQGDNPERIICVRLFQGDNPELIWR